MSDDNVDLKALMDCGALDLEKAFADYERSESYVNGRWVRNQWQVVRTIEEWTAQEDVGEPYRIAYVMQTGERYGIPVFRWAIQIDGKPVSDRPGDRGEICLYEEDAEQEARKWAAKDRAESEVKHDLHSSPVGPEKPAKKIAPTAPPGEAARMIS